jgi:DNA polymerase-3 subunit alpha
MSVLDSLISVKDLFTKVKELNQSAIAITDHISLANAYPALKISRSTGIKLIIGVESYFQEDPKEKFSHITLLAKNEIGYKNILKLNKKGFNNSPKDSKRIYSVLNWDLLEEHHDGVILLTGCGNGILNKLLMNRKFDEADKTLLRLKELFGEENLSLEVHPNNMKRFGNNLQDAIDQTFLNKMLINMGNKYNVRVTPTCNSHYLNKSDHEVHDIMLAIGSHQPVYSNFRLKYPAPEFYLKSGNEVFSFFARNYGDECAKELCNNSLFFSQKCELSEWIDPKFSNPSGKELPVFPVKDEKDYNLFLEWKSTKSEDMKKLGEDNLYLRYKCEIGLKEKGLENKQEYLNRVEVELDTLFFCKTSSYILIVADYINWCRENGVQVGIGRGSGAGSLVGYLLKIHGADPILYGLLFERFYNKLRTSFADYDCDFSNIDRHKVIEYIQRKYGENNVCQISNFIRNTCKVYVKDLARSLELGGSREAAIKIGNEIADIIPADIKNIDAAVEKCPLFSEYCKTYPQLLKYKDICNKVRSFGIHASGLIISNRVLSDIVPTRIDKHGISSIEYDKDVSEEVGLVKMDILGLKSLDIINDTNILIKKSNKEVPNINYEDNDEKTYNLISNADTFGIFQFGTSANTMDLCRKIKPKNIEDLAIITTLARPMASKEQREAFISSRNKNEIAVLLHPKLQNALQKTLGYPLYDEQLLNIAYDISGWNLSEADKLRKLTKEKNKNPEKAKKWKEEFISGAINNGINNVIATRIWEDIVEPFGKYSFNKSHAITYSMISYNMAYLKAHFPIEFLLANLMAEVNSAIPDSKSNIQKIKKELKSHKVKLISPDINLSELTYTITNNRLITGLDALKYVNEEAIKDIISKRPFKSFFDLMLRTDSSKVKANSIQAFAASGCLDGFSLPRKLMYLYCSDYRKKLKDWIKKHNPEIEEFIYPWDSIEDKEEWTLSERYALEQEYLGEAFICKPSKAYGDFFSDNHTVIKDVKKCGDKVKITSMRGIIIDFFEFKVKKEGSKYYGQSMVKATMEDMFGDQISLTIFPDRWAMFKDRMKKINSRAVFDKGLAINFSGSTNEYEDNIGVILDNLYNISIIPEVPNDLKAKKIRINKKSSNNSENVKKTLSMEEELEDELYDEGLIENIDEYGED